MPDVSRISHVFMFSLFSFTLLMSTDSQAQTRFVHASDVAMRLSKHFKCPKNGGLPPTRHLTDILVVKQPAKQGLSQASVSNTSCPAAQVDRNRKFTNLIYRYMGIFRNQTCPSQLDLRVDQTEHFHPMGGFR